MSFQFVGYVVNIIFGSCEIYFNNFKSGSPIKCYVNGGRHGAYVVAVFTFNAVHKNVNEVMESL